MRKTTTTPVILLLIVLWLAPEWAIAQDGGQFSGGFAANANWFIRDERIGADNIPQYDYQLIGSESWLDLRYSNWGFDFGIRFDLFNNSNLLNPNGSYSDKGIGRWFARKQIDKLTITGGYIYDQIGSGIIFRAYEERPILLDNALYGVQLDYQFSDDWAGKVFTGKQKFLFDEYESVIKGASLDGFLSFGNEEKGYWSMSPGVGVVNRTLSDEQMDNVVGILTTYSETDRFIPVYNVYLATVYNTLSAGPLTWYVEGAYKTDDVFFDPFATRTTLTGGEGVSKYVLRDGFVAYTSLSLALKGFGITVEYKRTEDFDIRADPLQNLNFGLMGYIPPMARVNTYRLTARYNAATQFVGEDAWQVDVRYSPNKKWSFAGNFSYIRNLEDILLYREIFTEVVYKQKRKWQVTAGVQLQSYNQELFEGKPEVPMVETVTPYFEFLYKFSRRKSLRFEAQYMDTEQDFGSWVFALAEYAIAPSWLFEVSGMYNIDPNPDNPIVTEPLLYPTFGVVYSHKATRYGLRYVKQVEGVVCSGGICRLEPAFSGVRFQVNTTF
jgi:hypothetical protein